MAIRVEREGIEACIAKINAAIEELNSAAGEVEKTMGDLPTYWEGAAYDKARRTYEADYQKLLTVTIPEAVEGFRDYINTCKEKIIEIDNMLANG
ncbi:MAG: hypothetical protein II977_04970 [Oscillospiraceae bacterium]|nr:hypothetical protein [Oscillospiraceae bacterium]